MKKTSLLVIADPDLHDLYRHLPLGGKVQLTVNDQALALLRREDRDMVLLDAGTDPPRAIDLLQQIKSAFPRVPVLFLSETASVELAVCAFRLGARDFIRRPFDVVKFRALVESLLDLCQKGGESRVCVPLERRDYFAVLGADGSESYLPPNILRVLTYLDAHLQDNLTLETLATVAGLSPYHFSRIFRELLGMPPMRFVSYQRVQRAKRLLRRDDLNITAVAAKAGFAHLNTLTRWFRIFEGTTPSRYRSHLAESPQSPKS